MLSRQAVYFVFIHVYWRYRNDGRTIEFAREITQREKVFSPGKIYPVFRLKYYYTAHVHETRDVTYNWVSNLPLLILPHRKACSWNRSVDGNKSPTLHHDHWLPIILLSTYRMSQYWALSIKHSGFFFIFFPLPSSSTLTYGEIPTEITGR